MKKPCKECPHFIRNCHMTEGVKDLWNVKDEKLECYGQKISTDIFLNEK